MCKIINSSDLDQGRITFWCFPSQKYYTNSNSWKQSLKIRDFHIKSSCFFCAYIKGDNPLIICHFLYHNLHKIPWIWSGCWVKEAFRDTCLVTLTATSSWVALVRTLNSWFRVVGRNLIITWLSMACRLWWDNITVHVEFSHIALKVQWGEKKCGKL